MIRASKYMDLDKCVLNVAACIISLLKIDPEISLSDLDETIQTRLGEDARFNFFPAINFLYLLGKLDYSETSDKIIAIGFN
jgi:hypothetical protein